MIRLCGRWLWRFELHGLAAPRKSAPSPPSAGPPAIQLGAGQSGPGQNHITALEHILAFLSMQGVTLNLGGKPLLDSADLSVEIGDRLCLVGRNGAGKSSSAFLALLGGQMLPIPACLSAPARSLARCLRMCRNTGATRFAQNRGRGYWAKKGELLRRAHMGQSTAWRSQAAGSATAMCWRSSPSGAEPRCRLYFAFWRHKAARGAGARSSALKIS